MLANVMDAAPQGVPWYWYVIGYGGQIVFGSRFYVQWLASEKHKRSVMPVVFWWLSLVGGLMSLAYAVYIEQGPFIMANIGGPPIYARNLYLIHRARRAPPGAPKAPRG